MFRIINKLKILSTEKEESEIFPDRIWMVFRILSGWFSGFYQDGFPDPIWMVFRILSGWFSGSCPFDLVR
jgi:hypothetical protein